MEKTIRIEHLSGFAMLRGADHEQNKNKRTKTASDTLVIKAIGEGLTYINMYFFHTNSNTLSKQHRYVCRGVLKGQHGAVACLAAHPLGAYVVSGGHQRL